jgi:hypothetical protein
VGSFVVPPQDDMESDGFLPPACTRSPTADGLDARLVLTASTPPTMQQSRASNEQRPSHADWCPQSRVVQYDHAAGAIGPDQGLPIAFQRFSITPTPPLRRQVHEWVAVGLVMLSTRHILSSPQWVHTLARTAQPGWPRRVIEIFRTVYTK